ncbi:hypothetical protein TIFTF001_051849 [Ficus carica]|uniref:RNase H type-1 domain-containing protein n=1 Tax=Ficus carica TaxID=3494 RepID=A0AA88JF32_FICCA|nr:hypothetical protein TIFTF001_051849 [Ficus carica]
MSDFRVSSLIMDIGWNQVLIEDIGAYYVKSGIRWKWKRGRWHVALDITLRFFDGGNYGQLKSQVRYGGGILPFSLAVSYGLGDLDAINHWRRIFEGRFDEPKEVVVRARRLLRDFLVCGLDEIAKPKQVVSKHKWKEHRCVKLNVDVAINDALGFIGIGVVARDDRGVVLGAVSRRMAGLFSSHVGECLAVKEGAWLALSCEFSKWTIETDALNVYNRFSVLLKQMSLMTFAILVCK